MINEKLEKRLNGLKKDRNVSVRLPYNIYNLLISRKNETIDKKLSTVILNILKKELLYTEEKIIKQGINNLFNNTRKINEKLDLLLLIWDGYLSSYFALHPEIPPNMKETFSNAAEARKEKFFKILMRDDIKNGGTTIEKIIANSMEEK